MRLFAERLGLDVPHAFESFVIKAQTSVFAINGDALDKVIQRFALHGHKGVIGRFQLQTAGYILHRQQKPAHGARHANQAHHRTVGQVLHFLVRLQKRGEAADPLLLELFVVGLLRQFPELAQLVDDLEDFRFGIHPVPGHAGQLLVVGVIKFKPHIGVEHGNARAQLFQRFALGCRQALIRRRPFFFFGHVNGDANHTLFLRHRYFNQLVQAALAIDNHVPAQGLRRQFRHGALRQHALRHVIARGTCERQLFLLRHRARGGIVEDARIKFVAPCKVERMVTHPDGIGQRVEAAAQVGFAFFDLAHSLDAFERGLRKVGNIHDPDDRENLPPVLHHAALAENLECGFAAAAVHADVEMFAVLLETVIKPLERGRIAGGEAFLYVAKAFDLFNAQKLAETRRHRLHAVLIPATIFQRHGARKRLQPVILAREVAFFTPRRHQSVEQTVGQRQFGFR